MCSIEDFTTYDLAEEKHVMRSPEDIPFAYRRCVGMVSKSREGNIVFNNAAQAASRKLLASYVGWDKEAADLAPPISFNFGALKPED
jgi:hypothetical protein